MVGSGSGYLRTGSATLTERGGGTLWFYGDFAIYNFLYMYYIFAYSIQRNIQLIFKAEYFSNPLYKAYNIQPDTFYNIFSIISPPPFKRTPLIFVCRNYIRSKSIFPISLSVIEINFPQGRNENGDDRLNHLQNYLSKHNILQKWSWQNCKTIS